MWNKGTNMMNRDQNINSDIPFMQGMNFTHPNNCLDAQFMVDASRKRKSLGVDLGYEGVSSGFPRNLGSKMGGHLRQGEYSMQQNVPLPPREDSRFKLPKMFYNCSSEHYKPSNTESPHGTFQFYGMDDSSVRSEAKNENNKSTSFDSLLPFQNYNEPTFAVQKLGELSEYHKLNHPICSSADPYEQSKFPSHYRKNSGLMEMSQAAPLRSVDGTHPRHENISKLWNPCLNPFNVPPSNDTTTLGSNYLRMDSRNFHSYGVNFGQKFAEDMLFDKTKRDNKECRNAPIGTAFTTQTNEFTEGRTPYDVCQYSNVEVRSENNISNDNLDGPLGPLNHREQSCPTTSQTQVLKESASSQEASRVHVDLNDTTHVSMDFKINLLKSGKGSSAENKGPPSEEESLPLSGSSFASRRLEGDTRPPVNLEEHSHFIAGKIAPLVTEKLWDGSLQLNTSTTVSAVAFFKSGEKAPDIKWSEHVEVKGKVRLQAFEKYIQELPRSRNRALMVISICWKVGSSEAGLTGIKQVSKGYRENDKVGFAQICQGLDLYVCPRSDTIITILAKYGFFKGMTAAVQDDQDSLIGCVIWRRGSQTSLSNPVPDKISEKKKTTQQLQEQQQEIKLPSVVLKTHSLILQAGDELKNKQDQVAGLDSSTMAEKVALQQSGSVGNFHINSTVSMPPYDFPPVSVPKLETTSTFLQEVTVKPPNKPTSLQETMTMHPPIPPSPIIKIAGQIPIGPPTHNSGLYNSCNYTFCPPPHLVKASVPLDSPFISGNGQLPTKGILDSSFGPNPMQNSNYSKPELAEPATPRPPPPSPPDILQRINQFSKEAPPHKVHVPSEGISKVEASFTFSEASQKKCSVSYEARPKSVVNMDDGDLPEFDFDSACGIPRAPRASESALSPHHQTKNYVAAPFNKQFSVDALKKESGLTTTLPPVVHTYKETVTISTLPAKSFKEEFSAEQKQFAADVHQALQQSVPMRVIDEDSSSCSSSSHKKTHLGWNDDDDDMPEWCPPDLDNVDQLPKQTSANATRVGPPIPIPIPIPRPKSEHATKQSVVPAPSFSTPPFCSPFQSLSHGHSYPGMPGGPHVSVNHAPPAQRGPPQMPHSNPSLRFPAPNFGSKSPPSDVKRQQWK